MSNIKTKAGRRQRIKKGIRRKLEGTTVRPRLSVIKSNKAIYAQIIDDSKGITLASTSSVKEKINKSEQAKLVGKIIAEKALALGITGIRFDRNGYLYHGRVKTLAESAREAGLKF